MSLSICFRAVCASAAALAILVFSPPLRAQSLCNEDPTACQAPVITITPGSGSYNGSAGSLPLVVTVDWCSGFLSPTSRHVYLDGQEVTQSFVAATGSCGARQGTLTLTPGMHTVSATGATTTGVQGSASASYTYTQWTDAVVVTPRGSAVQRAPGEGGAEMFTVKNTSGAAATYSIAASCSGAGIASCFSSQAAITVAAGDSARVPVAYATYTAGAGSTVSVMLKAWKAAAPAVRDSGSYSVALVAQAIVNEGPDRTRLDRDGCVTIAAGPATAFECGDLRAVHGLPATRVLNRARAPVLFYSSQHARPYPVVAATVRPAAGTRPDSVRATLHLAYNNANYTAAWKGWPSDTAKHVAVAFDATALPTGVYDYTLEVSGTFNAGGSQSMLSQAGQISIVNRSASPYGAGWWVAGVEQLVPGASGVLWVGGDGSTRLYRPVPGATGRWAADAFDRPDTLLAEGSGYVRALPGHVRVRFNALGQHTETVDTLGRATTFAYASGRLASITLPAGGYAYTFEYGNNGGTRLSRVVSPVPSSSRYSWVEVDASGDLRSVTDPDSSVVRFGYGVYHRLTSRTDRRGFVTSYGYDAASRLGSVTRADGSIAFFSAAEATGLSSTGAVVRPYTGYNGFRTDVPDITYFYVDRFGQPTAVVDPLNNVTTIYRSDAGWPGRVSSVKYPDGRLLAAAYDARGNLVASADWGVVSGGRKAIATYEWDPVWDAVTKVTLPEGEVVMKGYTPLGQLDWTQQGTDPARRVRFGYYGPAYATAPGLLSTVTYPAAGASPAAMESYQYNSLGNFSAGTSALGHTTQVFSDAIGRDTLTVPPMGARTRAVYDAAGRVVRTTTFAGSDSLVVVNEYDREGDLTALERSTVPDLNHQHVMRTDWAYDALGRKVRESTLAGSDSTIHDAGGNVTEYRSRRRDPVTGLPYAVRMQYDTLGRLKRRITPAARYTPVSYRRWERDWIFPLYPLDIAEDTAAFVYDAMGNLKYARNRDGSVTRTYDAAGRLSTDRVRIRSYDRSTGDTLGLAYTMAYTYDLDGRRISLKYPGSLMVGTGTPDSLATYQYDAQTGALSSVRDVAGNVFSFFLNSVGQPDSTIAPGMRQTYRYDLEGSLVYQGGLGATSLERDSAGRVTAATGLNGAGAQYSPFGPLKHWNQSLDERWWVMDPLGNPVTEDHWTSQIDPTPGQHLSRRFFSYALGQMVSAMTFNDNTHELESQENYNYDPAGNRDESGSETFLSRDTQGSRYMEEESRLYYDAGDKLRAVDQQHCTLYTAITQHCEAVERYSGQKPSVWEEYRYDPLGRRIMKVTRYQFGTGFFLDGVDRTIWDGDQIVAEIRSGLPGNDDDIGETYGRVIYTHGPGIDAPLSLVRVGHPTGLAVILLRRNWRGFHAGGAFPDGSQVNSGGLSLSTLDWASKSAGAFLNRTAPWEETPWFGSLITEQRDGSGQIYRRNRYYDGATGQFTQEDPIGFAGGLNLYGFGGGDPANYSDPYGLCSLGDMSDCTHREIQDLIGTAHPIAWYNDPLFYAVTMGVEVFGKAGTTLGGRAAGNLAERGLAALARRGGGGALREIVYVGRFVGRLQIGQDAAARFITATVGRLGYEIGEDTMIGSLRYLVSKTVRDGVSHAIEIAADGTTREVLVQGSGRTLMVVH